MRKIGFDELEEGMVLAEDVAGKDGHVILRAGTRISERHRNLLQANGIHQVWTGTPGEQTTPAAATPEIEEQIADRFRHVDAQHAFVQELMRLCRDRLLKQEAGS